MTDALWAAWPKLRNAGPGIDGVHGGIFARDVDARIHALAAAVANRTYRPAPLLYRDKLKEDGRVRRLGIPTLTDRLLQTSLHMQVQGPLDRLFGPHVHGYRPGHSPSSAVDWLIHHVGTRPKLVLAKADITSLFDNLPHDRLLPVLDAAWPDPTWCWLHRQWCAAWASSPGRGVPQGAPLSPLIANLYLSATVDPFLVDTLRYADDFLCVGDGPAWVLVNRLEGIVQRAGLALSARKTYVEEGEKPLLLLGIPVRRIRVTGGWRIARVQPVCLPWSPPDWTRLLKLR